jgi:hypothetical protein
VSRHPDSRPGSPPARRSRRASNAAVATILDLGLACAIAFGAALWLASKAVASPSTNRHASYSDVFWKRPDFAEQAPGSIALLPAFSFDSNQERERVAAAAWAANFGQSGYRWVSAPTARTLLSSSGSGDSLLNLARAAVLKGGRVDSLLAPALCARMRVRAVLSVRIDTWDTRAVELNDTGKPWSRAFVKAALVDSLGRLLWSAEGGETVEGLYHEAQSHATGVDATAPHSEFDAGAGTPPVPLEVFARIFQRWSTSFPGRAAPSSP